MERIDSQTGEVTEAIVLSSEQPGSAMTLFGSDKPKEAMARMTEVATVLADVIEKKGLFLAIADKKTNKVKKHVFIEGWTLLGSLLGVFPRTISCEPVTSDSGVLLGYKAHVEAVTRAGQVIGAATALCMKSEKRGPWSYADDYALASMAQTRAASKVLRMPLGFIMQLAGYDALPSDEVPEGGFPDPPRPVNESAKAGPQAQGRATPDSVPVPEKKAAPARALDAKGRPAIPADQSYHECPSCHGRQAGGIETVRVNPTTGEAFCWKQAKGCGATFTKSLWDVVSVEGPSSTDPPPPTFEKPNPGFGATEDDVFPPNDDLSNAF